MTNDEEYPLPFEVGGMPSDESVGEITPFSTTELRSFQDFDTYLEGEENTDLYVGDGKNVYRLRKRKLEDDDIVYTSECIGVCNPDEYELIMENEDGLSTVLGYIESNFAYYNEEDRFIPSQAETTIFRPDFGKDPGDDVVMRAMNDELP